MRKLTKKKGCLLAACILSALANNVFAAETENAAEKYKMEEYVVTATRTELTEKEVPQSVEVITKEEIQDTGAITVRDVLRNSTSIHVIDGGGGHGDKLSMRGSDSNDILILINGRRVAGENLYGNGSGNNRALDRLNLSNVERIEIVRGQAGALYGSDAQAGVINIITRKSETPEFTVGFNTGSRSMNNYYHLDTGKQGKVSAAFDANFGKLRNFDGKAGIGFVEGPTQYYSLDVDYDMDEDNKLNLFLEYNKENFDYSVTYADFGLPGVYSNSRDQERKTAALSYDGKNKNSNYIFSATYSQLDSDSSGHSMWLDTTNMPPAMTVVGTEEDRTYKLWMFEARDSIQTAENNKLTFGGEYRINEGSAHIDGGDDRTDQYALYLQDEFYVNDKLLLIPSVRYNHHDEFGSETTPNIGMTYFIADNSRFKANYGQAYRAPSIDELYGTFNHMGMFTIYGNSDLKPEKTKGYELSYEHEFGEKTSAKLTYFNNEKEDAIELDKSEEGIWRYYNVNNTSTEGVEFEIKHELGNGFSLIGNYAYLDAKNDDTNSRLEYSSRNTYTAKLQWTEPVEKEWSITAWNRWYSDYYDGSDTYSGNTLNFVVNKTWADNKYNAFVGIDNVFDKEIDELNYYGRMWRCGFEMTF